MKKTRNVKRTLFLFISAVTYAGSKLRSAFRKSRPGCCTILYYHGVADEQRQRFARQMDALLRWTRPVSIDFPDPLQGGVRYSAVTFDDGFESVLLNALPELESRNIPFAVFIIADALGKNLEWEGYPERLMTLEEIQRLPSNLTIIGSHTMTHPHLPSLSERDARRELLDARLTLARLLNRDVPLFSFPYGAFTEELIGWCREAGYKKIFTTLPYSASGQPSEFVVGRVSVEPSDWPIEFYLKIRGGYRWLAPAIQWKRKFVLSIRGILGLNSAPQVQVGNPH